MRSGAWPTLGLIALCLALGGVSLLLPYTLSGDEWCWLSWGREVGRLALDTTACTVWKPLPVLFTTVISQAGDAAPMLWLLLVRASWLLALVLAYRVGTRLGGRPAGVVAALGLLLIRWTDARRRAFANDLANSQLIAVSASSNRSKGDRGPVAWKPPRRAAWCLYARWWVQVKRHWRLTVILAERLALRRMLATC